MSYANFRWQWLIVWIFNIVRLVASDSHKSINDSLESIRTGHRQIDAWNVSRLKLQENCDRVRSRNSLQINFVDDRTIVKSMRVNLLNNSIVRCSDDSFKESLSHVQLIIAITRTASYVGSNVRIVWNSRTMRLPTLAVIQSIQQDCITVDNEADVSIAQCRNFTRVW